MADSAYAYLEVQVWGELDIRDVAYFLAVPDTPTTVVSQLKAAGLPICEGRKETRGYKESFAPGKELYAGDPSKIKLYAESLAASRHRFAVPVEVAIKNCAAEFAKVAK